MLSVRSIVFDAYGTLFNVNSLDKRLAGYFGNQATGISADWRRKQLEYTWLRTLMGKYRPFSEVTLEALTFACESAGVKLSSVIRDDMMKRYFSLDAFPEVPEILSELSKSHSLAILSNANHDMLRGAVSHNHIGHTLKHIFSADSIRKFKPSPEVYQLAVDTLDLPGKEIAFVSGNTWDIAGAHSFGLFTVWLNRKGAIMEQLGFRPDLEIKSLQNLVVNVNQ